MVRYKEFPEEMLKKYYLRICEFLEMSSFWRYLQHKAEYGSTRNEKEYQVIAKSMIESIAKDLGYHVNKAAALSMAVGCCFPKYGQAGLKIIKEYVKEHHIDIEHLEVETIEDYIYRKIIIASDFHQMLLAYYSNDSSIPEVCLVRKIQETIRKIKRIECYGNYEGNLLCDVSVEMKTLCKQEGRIVEIEMLDELIESIEIVEEKMNEEEIEKFINTLSTFTEFYNKEGIYHFIVLE